MRARIERKCMIDDITSDCEAIIASQPRDAMGHGYLWVTTRPSPTRGIKFLAASIDGRANHGDILAAVLDLPDVASAYILMD